MLAMRTLPIVTSILLLTSCSSANIAANEAAIAAFFNTVNADAAAVWAGVLQNCAAIQLLAQDAQVLACMSTTKAQNAVQRGMAAANVICSSPQSSSVVTDAVTIASAVKAAKTAQLTSTCGS
jgi:hypothetical protein